MLRQMEGSVDPATRESQPGEENPGDRRPSDGVDQTSRRLSGSEVKVETGMASGDEVGACQIGAGVDPVSSEDDAFGDGTGSGHDASSGADTLQQSFLNTPTGRRGSRVENMADLTPNFRSAAAMAGWDDEALVLGAGGQGSPAGVFVKQGMGRGTLEDSSRASCSSACENCTQYPQCRERKRGTRTPGQAATPLSARRRHSRVRRVSSNEEPLVPIPMAVLVNEGDQGSRQPLSQDKENRDAQPLVKTTSLKATGGATGGATGEAAESNRNENGVLQVDKLREELTCVVCLDICFEPSTTDCGHSFCRGCLQSAFQKCGMRCPKCRQELRATSKNDCPINTVLWNTIQLLFPQETAARLKDQKNCENDEISQRVGSEGTEQADSHLRLGLVRRTARPIPWRELVTASRETERSRSYLSLFGRVSDAVESGQPTVNYPNRLIRVRVRRPTSLLRNPATLIQQNDDRRSIMPSSWRSPETLRQEEEDAALAARLQQSFISEARL